MTLELNDAESAALGASLALAVGIYYGGPEGHMHARNALEVLRGVDAHDVGRLTAKVEAAWTAGSRAPGSDL